MDPPHVVIIGAGFGGLACARTLGERGIRVTIVDRSNHHLFQPLLYQVATAGLAAPAIAAPTRFLLRKYRNVQTLMADVASVLPRAAQDQCWMMARRCNTTTSSSPAAPPTAISVMKNGHRMHPGSRRWRMRRRSVDAYCRPSSSRNAPRPMKRRTSWLRFVVIGGGPTGVELAGTLAEIARHTLPQEFRRIDSRRTEVHLLEAADRVLGAFPSTLSDKARLQLERLGVTVRLGTRVVGIDAAGVTLAQGSRLRATPCCGPRACGVTAGRHARRRNGSRGTRGGAAGSESRGASGDFRGG